MDHLFDPKAVLSDIVSKVESGEIAAEMYDDHLFLMHNTDLSSGRVVVKLSFYIYRLRTAIKRNLNGTAFEMVKSFVEIGELESFQISYTETNKTLVEAELSMKYNDVKEIAL